MSVNLCDRLQSLIDNPPIRCGDHSCIFGGPKGMGTNGGCRCMRYPEDLSRTDLLRLKSWISNMRAVAKEMARLGKEP